MKKFKLILLLIFLASGFFHLQKAQAIEYEMLGGKPAHPDANVKNSESWFIYSLAPGEAKEDALEVINLFSDSWEALVYAGDTTSSSSGGFALKQFSEPKTEVGSWVRFYPSDPPEIFQKLFKENNSSILTLCGINQADLELKIGKKNLTEASLGDLKKWCDGEESVKQELKSQEKITIPFIIKVPQDSEVGEHTGGILIQKVAPEVQDAGEGSSIKLTTRVGVRIYETVPGEIIRKLSLLDFQIIKSFKEFSWEDLFGKLKKPQEYILQTRVKNEGNVSLEQNETIHIKNLLFSKGSTDIPRSFQVLKQDSFISNYTWRNPRFGYFSFATEIKYQDAQGKDVILNSPEEKILIMPWREITVAAIFLILILGGYGVWRVYQKRKYGAIGWVEYQLQEGENVNSLALRYNLDWKILAKANKLKAPYLLQAGQLILVPPGEEDISELLRKKLDQEISQSNAKEPEREARKIELPKEEEKIIEEASQAAKIEIPPIKKEELVIPVEEVAPAQREGAKIEKLAAFEKLLTKQNETPEKIDSTEEEKTSFFTERTWWIIIAVGVAIIVIGAGEMLLLKIKNGGSAKTEIEINAPSAESSAENQENKVEVPAPEVKKEIKAEEITVKVLNEGAPAGMAGKIKEFLIVKGYTKAEAKNGEQDNIQGTVVYYLDADYQQEAGWIKEMLAGKKIMAEVKMAETEEEKSGQIVIILGK